MYLKDGNPSKIEIPARIVNHRISMFTPKYLEICSFIDVYANSLDDETFNQMIYIFTKKEAYLPKTSHFKQALQLQKEKIEEIKNKQYEWLYDEIVKYYNWGETEKELYRTHYEKLFEDISKLKYFFEFFGVQESQYKKYIK